MRLDIRGIICKNDNKWVYDWLEMDATCPRDVQQALDGCPPGETLDIYINSPGGEVHQGSEIYTAIRAFRGDVKIHVTGLAASAASVILCAAQSDISPTAMVMIHCVSTSISGNHNDLELMAETLTKADRAMCQAYVEKTGRPEKDLLKLMNKEHWMTAQEAVDMGFCDGIMESGQQPMLVAACGTPVIGESAAAKLRNLLEQNQLAEQLARFNHIIGGTV